jgi:undecaprenyl diphosphate synthase
LPRHIAIIMDGNGRWARERGMPRIKGHEAGAKSVRAVTEACAELGIPFLTVYAFSTENWKRPADEVAALFGRLNELPDSCQLALRKAIAQTAGNTRITLILALNYSARTEIVDAVRTLCINAVAGELAPEEIDAEVMSRHLYTREYPDPDLLIRTSGEMRLSNFLLWQLSYTEIHVTSRLWPDFGKEDLQEAVDEYSKRQRRYGGV